jgi:hypothetical protein
MTKNLNVFEGTPAFAWIREPALAHNGSGVLLIELQMGKLCHPRLSSRTALLKKFQLPWAS